MTLTDTAYKLTHTGRAVNLFEVKPADVCLGDIAWHLAHINRWTGATKRAMSVAEHSLLVTMIMERSGAMLDPAVLQAALMHDAHEYLTNDIDTASKRLVGDAWHAMARDVQRAIDVYFDVADAARQHRGSIKHADLVAQATELRDLMPAVPTHALRAFDHLVDVEPINWLDLNDWTGMDAQDWAGAFAEKYAELQAMRRAYTSTPAASAA